MCQLLNNFSRGIFTQFFRYLYLIFSWGISIIYKPKLKLKIFSPTFSIISAHFYNVNPCRVMTNKRDIIFQKMQHIWDSSHTFRKKAFWNKLRSLGFIFRCSKTVKIPFSYVCETPSKVDNLSFPLLVREFINNQLPTKSIKYRIHWIKHENLRFPLLVREFSNLNYQQR